MKSKDALWGRRNGFLPGKPWAGFLFQISSRSSQIYLSPEKLMTQKLELIWQNLCFGQFYLQDWKVNIFLSISGER